MEAPLDFCVVRDSSLSSELQPRACPDLTLPSQQCLVHGNESILIASAFGRDARFEGVGVDSREGVVAMDDCQLPRMQRLKVAEDLMYEGAALAFVVGEDGDTNVRVITADDHRPRCSDLPEHAESIIETLALTGSQ